MKWHAHILIDAPDDATKDDIDSFLYDLEWVGGCRDPDNDPMSDSVKVLHIRLTKARKWRVSNATSSIN